MIKTTLCECTLINMGQSPTSDSYNEFGDGIPFYQGNADFGEIIPIKKYYCNKPIKIAIIMTFYYLLERLSEP